MSARTLRDDHGVPHVRAGSLLELAHEQGRVAAHDRAWQLEWLRRRATGTSAELLGAGCVPGDRLVRRTRVADTALRAHAALDPATRAFVASYVAGVNAGLRGDVPELLTLGAEPGAWEEWMPLAVFHAQHLLFASLPGKLWDARAREVLGEEAALLSHEGPLASGSNAWAVGGGRTASGMPLVAGDPHRTIESPGVYQQVRLACEDPDDAFDVVGFAFPGVPGVQHFAHAGDVAWAITNAMADYQDVFAERLRRVDGRVEAKGPDGWEPTESHAEEIPVRDGDPVPVEVVVTARGPVFADGDDGRAWSLRDAATVVGELGFGALLPLLRARSVADVDAALDAWVEPVNNVVVADRAGRLLYRIAGRVPVRPETTRRGIADAADPHAGWTGWLAPLPRTVLSPDDQVVTANERRGRESAAVGTTFAPPHRAARLRALLTDRSDLTPEDFASFHGDALLPTLAEVRDLLHDAGPGPVHDAILGWDGRMETGSAGAAAFAAWRSAFVRRLADEPVFAPLRVPLVDDPVFAPWLDLTGRLGLALDSLLPAALAGGTPYGLDLRALAAAALDDAADHPETWGETHVVRPVHAFDGSGLEPPTVPALPVAGDIDCVRCTGSVPGVTDACARGSVARYVWDLADRERSGWVVPMGASADPRDPHHLDQLPLWAAGRLAPVVTDWERLHP
ncbi:penicillin amidase [Nocardioides ginsengisegetis]|uniref:Penicillin amidase n=1 Tax=Nocardioides ginsengisegetis TaxID=661491 RepID=A0A7W3J108_9ACTN|nr:penicillin acylase family protein [Nocardioides ginsengisegetis]MBA8804336.1 penicillin amidase [Nocardioides ginsengisegetis]